MQLHPTDETLAIGDVEQTQTRASSSRASYPCHANPTSPRRGPFLSNPFHSVSKSLSKMDESTRFGIRIMTSASLASLFPLLLPSTTCTAETAALPESLWIVITAIIVSWQASPDIASVAKKMIQRLVGTLLGASIGLAVGGLSLTLNHGSTGQQIYSLVSISLGTFAFAFLAARNGFRAHYSAVLGCVTFALVLLAFYDIDRDQGWRIGVFRLVNICIGGILAGLVSLLMFPLSTTDLIKVKVAALVKETGATSRAVLSATVSNPPPRLVLLARKLQDEDESHQRYMKALSEWKRTKELFDLLAYDHTYQRMPKTKQHQFWEAYRLRLGRVLRLQVTLVMMDGLNRSRLHALGDDYQEIFTRTGDRLEQLLDSDGAHESSNEEAANQLMDEDLPRVRHLRTMLQKQISCEGDLMPTPVSTLVSGTELSLALSVFDSIDDPSNSLAAKFFAPTQTSIHFLQLVEFLIIRALRLHRYIVHTESEAAMDNV